MPVTSVQHDPEKLTLSVVADFAVPVQRLWNAYTDPRQIEKFWGPVEWPATFTRHDVIEGGRSEYYMTSPEGEKAGGYWEFLSVDEGRSFEVTDGFVDEDGRPNPEMPSMRMTFSFEETDDGSRLITTTYFRSKEELDQLLAMGMEEGMLSAMSQIDAVLADLRSFSAGLATQTQTLSETQVRISRIISSTPEQVWRAHHEPELITVWMLGPDGWVMPVCEPGSGPGDTFRYEWERAEGGDRFGFTGEIIESVSPVREVTTERMIGDDSPGTVNEMTLTPTPEGTLLTLVITYPDAEVRDIVLGTGMTDGMEAGYARLEQGVLPSIR